MNNKIILSRFFKDLLDNYTIDEQGNIYKDDIKLTT